MMREQYTNILTALEKTRADALAGRFTKEFDGHERNEIVTWFGICYQARERLDEKAFDAFFPVLTEDELPDFPESSDPGFYLTLSRLWAEWPKHSGNETFPIPLVSPYDCERGFGIDENCWAGEYLNLRLELLDYTIDLIKNKLETM